MSGILAKITSLGQHIQHFHDNPEDYRPSQCPYCHKSGVWAHGCYKRAVDRDEKTRTRDLLDPVPIPRFLCPHCGKTCSTLPECIPPRRWYLWVIQQAALLSLLAGESLPPRKPSKRPGRSTIKRWWNGLKEDFHLHADTLRAQDSELGRVSGFLEFWQECLGKMSLSEAMYLLHKGGLIIP
jgi:hypothetical protein